MRSLSIACSSNSCRRGSAFPGREPSLPAGASAIGVSPAGSVLGGVELSRSADVRVCRRREEVSGGHDARFGCLSRDALSNHFLGPPSPRDQCRHTLSLAPRSWHQTFSLASRFATPSRSSAPLRADACASFCQPCASLASLRRVSSSSFRWASSAYGNAGDDGARAGGRRRHLPSIAGRPSPTRRRKKKQDSLCVPCVRSVTPYSRTAATAVPCSSLHQNLAAPRTSRSSLACSARAREARSASAALAPSSSFAAASLARFLPASNRTRSPSRSRRAASRNYSELVRSVDRVGGGRFAISGTGWPGKVFRLATAARGAFYDWRPGEVVIAVFSSRFFSCWLCGAGPFALFFLVLLFFRSAWLGLPGG